MQDGQWELIYPGTDIVLGSDPTLPISTQRAYHHMKSPDIGEVEVENEDQNRPGADGVVFGQDYRGGRLITFELGVKGTDPDDSLALSETLLRAWRGDTLRVAPGQLATLCTSVSGRLRQVYGRPGHCSTSDTIPRSAFMLATCDFRTVNDLWYDPAVQSVTVNLAPSTSGGFSAPFSAPITTSSPTTRDEKVVVGGTTNTYPVITINGPVTQPRITVVGGWTLSLDVTVSAGQQLIIDCRPWARSVVRSDGASFAGKLSRTSRLSAAVLVPGSVYTVSYGGTDLTGASTMTFAWNNAYVSK